MFNTLTARLFFLSSLIALVGVAIVAYVISDDYQLNAEKRLKAVLAANVYNLMSTFELDESGNLTGIPQLGDARYGVFDSGWYWFVEKVDDENTRITSPSLGGRKLSVPHVNLFDKTYQRAFEFKDYNGDSLLGLEALVYLGEGDNLYSLSITANKTISDTDIQTFTQRLAIILSAFAFSIILATYLAVRIGLKPISKATNQLGEIRRGDADKIEGKFPEEIQPLINETNALIVSNNTIVERARTQVGNLAHSLKTPLAVIQNELPSITGSKGKLLQEQLETMRDQVHHYLDRARISARSSTAIASTPLLPTLEQLVKVIQKLNPDLEIKTNYANASQLTFCGEKHDLQEVVGNLLENAAKYANNKIALSVDYKDGCIIIHVDDDGIGMSDKDMKTVTKRGVRADESIKGWGFGLSIVGDIIDEYQGKFELSHSELGGLRASVNLLGQIIT